MSMALTLGCGRPTNPRLPVGVVHDVPLAGVTLHTVELGTRAGPVVYLLHDGPGLDHTLFRPSMDFLARTGHPVFIDLRGHGRSSAPPDSEGYTLTAAADDLAALVRARGDRTVDVLGHGFGGAIAVVLAARHPEVVRRLVLVDPLRDGAQVRDRPRRALDALGASGWARVQALQTPQGTLRDARTLPVFLRRLGALWWHRSPSAATIDELVRAMVYRQDADANFNTDALTFNARFIAADVRAPALVVSGDDDREYLAAESRGLAEALPHGRYVAIAGAGHLPFVEQSETFDRIVGDFLGSGSRPE